MMGPATRDAIRRYQRSFGLPADGYPTLDLLERLQEQSPGRLAGRASGSSLVQDPSLPGPMRCSGLRFQHGDLYCSPQLEAQTLVQCDRRMVVRPRMKKWLLAALLDDIRNDR